MLGNLELRGVTKIYRRLPDRVLGVEDISLVLRPGEVVGLLGPNGAGKTTLLKILATTLSDYQGEVVYDGRLIDPSREHSLQAYRHQLGYLPESPFIFSKLTGREYLRFVGDLYAIAADEFERRVTRLLEIFELAGSEDMFLSAYSQGMLKKIALIVALINDQGILLLDEPSNGLDPKGIATLGALVAEAGRAGKIVLLSTHILEVAQKLSDRIVILQAGTVKWEGPVHEIPGADAAVGRSSLEDFFFDQTETGGTKS